MARVNTRLGDVFSVIIDGNSKKYFHHVANDLTQLNSDVIRAFKTTYPLDANPELKEIVKGEIGFYAHCVIKWGIKFGFWQKVGNCSDVGKVDVLFRSSSDDGNPQIKVSHNWWVWKINEEQKRVGRLEGENQNAEIGSVIPPDSIVHRLRTGQYDFVYPSYQ
jgi:hypothetical protein